MNEPQLDFDCLGWMTTSLGWDRLGLVAKIFTRILVASDFAKQRRIGQKSVSNTTNFVWHVWGPQMSNDPNFWGAALSKDGLSPRLVLVDCRQLGAFGSFGYRIYGFFFLAKNYGFLSLFSRMGSLYLGANS